MKKFRFTVLFFIVIFVSACSIPSVKKEMDASTNRVTPEVSGTISLIFAPTPPKIAKIPNPPFDLSLILKAKDSDANLVHKLVDPNPIWDPTDGNIGVTLNNFTFNLEAGNYQILGLEINSQSLGRKEFMVPLPGPYFTIDDNSTCTYVGRINFALMRLPPGSYEQARKGVQVIAKQYNRDLTMVYLPKGTLIPFDFSVNKPEEKDQAHNVLSSSYSHYRKSIDSGCEMKLIQFSNR